MKKKFIIINVFLSFAVLFSILFQAAHSYVYHSELTAKHYNFHNYKDKTDISCCHVSEKCMACDFNFSSFTTTDFFVFQFQKYKSVAHLPFCRFQLPTAFFLGYLFALRAPPII